jgi:hypothetical protein
MERDALALFVQPADLDASEQDNEHAVPGFPFRHDPDGRVEPAHEASRGQVRDPVVAKTLENRHFAQSGCGIQL